MLQVSDFFYLFLVNLIIIDWIFVFLYLVNTPSPFLVSHQSPCILQNTFSISCLLSVSSMAIKVSAICLLVRCTKFHLIWTTGTFTSLEVVKNVVENQAKPNLYPTVKNQSKRISNDYTIKDGGVTNTQAAWIHSSLQI